MGQQQLLLIILGIIVVGAAVVVGIDLFRANAIEQKRNSILNECIILASLAQKYYLKPVSIGGGGLDYTGFLIPDELESTESGNFRITAQSQNSLTILGTGNEVVTHNDSIQVQIVVPNPPNEYEITVIN